MPYGKFPEGGKVAVYKIDANKQKVGKRLGLHPDDKAANAQLAALYASEKGAAKKEVPYTITASDGETTTGTIPVIIENFEVKTKDGGYEPEPIPVKVVEDDDDMMTGALSFADLMAQAEAEEMQRIVSNLTDQFGQIACNIMCAEQITDKAAALKDLAAEFQTMMDTYVKHEAAEETPGEEIEDHLAEEMDDSEDKELVAIQQIIGDNQPNKDKAVWTAASVNDLPDSSFLHVKPGGKKDDGGKTVPRSLRMFPYKDASGKVDLPHLRNAVARIPQAKGLAPDLKKQLQDKARKMLENTKKELDPQLFIWKEDGQYLWLSAYSNNRLDREGEIISSESHKEFDEALHKGEWPMPELWLWHIPYPVGQADYHAYDESSGFPVAAGHFNPGMEWAAEGVVKEGWDAASHGMPEQWIKRDRENESVIVRHRTKEITFLPLRAAANQLAFNIISKESTMDEVTKGLPAHKRSEFVKAFGEERVKKMEEVLASKAKEADAAGIAKKEATEPTLTKEDLVKGLDVVLDKVKEAFDAFDARLGKLESAQVKEADQYDLMAVLKAKSIIGKDAAKVDGRSTLAKDAPEETPAQAANAHPVGLVNNLFAANEAWAQRQNGGR